MRWRAFWNWENLAAAALATCYPPSPDPKIVEGIETLAIPFRTLVSLFCDVLSIQVVNAGLHFTVVGSHKFVHHFKTPFVVFVKFRLCGLRHCVNCFFF